MISKSNVIYVITPMKMWFRAYVITPMKMWSMWSHQWKCDLCDHTNENVIYVITPMKSYNPVAGSDESSPMVS